MQTFKLTGRLLFLSTKPEIMQQQVSGKDVTAIEAGTLRDDVSTDEITPLPIMTHYDDKLGRYTYTGFKSGDTFPFKTDSVRNAGFCVTIAGSRYGKGSSREHSPAAEKLAGIKLVIAKSFERIYRQNADNIGLFTSTDLSLIGKLERGEEITIDELVAGRDALAAEILKCGGLLEFGRKYMQEVRVSPQPETTSGQTLFEKILRRHWLKTPLTSDTPVVGQGGFVRADRRFIHEYYTGMGAHLLHTTFGKPVKLLEPESIVLFEDHTSYVAKSPAHIRGGLIQNVHGMRQAQRDFVADYNLHCHTTLTDEEAALDDGSNVAGISHAMIAEHYALPGQVVVGTDSHTPHSGSLGCLAFGVGTTDMMNAFVTGAVRITVPDIIRIDLEGAIKPGVTAKDVVLHLLALPDIKAGSAIGKVFEFTGPVTKAFSIDERATLTNMVAELGGFTGIVAPDEKTVSFLKARRGIDFVIEPWMKSDSDAHYPEIIRVDCSALEPLLAKPGDPSNRVAVSELTEDIRIDIAYGGSCTAGKREDFDYYHSVFSWALQHGFRKPDHVQLFLQFGTTAVRDYCIEKGYMPVFERVGATILQPSCGACGNCGPGSSDHEGQITISAINRNFPGRSGPGQVWLGSPPTIAASAMAGKIVSFDGLQKMNASKN
ncbi:MAG TPA: 3-isopropylmalate dehydratase [Alcaligenaceae bacterium]|nr:3-isopropylmalate dehydratase [Alcaligenaceae bacterium]